MYRLTSSGNAVIRIADGAFVPADPENIDFAAYVQWLAVGNVPLSADAPPPTKAQRVAAVLNALPRPMTREQVQTTIIACEAYAKANSLPLTYIYAKTKLYTLSKDAEAACAAIEAGP